MDNRIEDWDRINQEECFDMTNGMSLMDTQLLVNGVLHGSAPETSGEMRNVLQLYSNQPNFYSQVFPNEIYRGLVENINSDQLNLTKRGVDKLTQQVKKDWLDEKTSSAEIADIYNQKINEAKERGDWVTIANLQMGLGRRGQPSKAQRIQNLVEYSFHKEHGELIESVERSRDRAEEIADQIRAQGDDSDDPFYDLLNDKSRSRDYALGGEGGRRRSGEGGRRRSAETDFGGFDPPEPRDKSFTPEEQREQDRRERLPHNSPDHIHSNPTAVNRGSVRTPADRSSSEQNAWNEAMHLIGQGGREGQGVPRYREEGYMNAADWVAERMKEGGQSTHQRMDNAPNLSQEYREMINRQHANPRHEDYHDGQWQSAIEQARIHEEQIAMERAASHPVSGDDMIHQRSDRDTGEHFRQFRHQTSGGLDVSTVGGDDSDIP